MKTATLLVAIAAVACGDPVAPPISGDDPSAIVGLYNVETVNGAATFPSTLESTAGLTVQLGDASLTLRGDGSYSTTQYLYEIRPTESKGIPQSGAGRFALHGQSLEFVATTGTAPETATVVGGKLRVVQSVRAGRKADTLTFKR